MVNTWKSGGLLLTDYPSKPTWLENEPNLKMYFPFDGTTNNWGDVTGHVTLILPNHVLFFFQENSPRPEFTCSERSLFWYGKCVTTACPANFVILTQHFWRFLCVKNSSGVVLKYQNAGGRSSSFSRMVKLSQQFL